MDHLKVWMDIDQMAGSTLQSMAEAVENADIFLMAMSHKYKDSPNCRAGKINLPHVKPSRQCRSRLKQMNTGV